MPNSRRTNALDDSQAALRMLLTELEELAPSAPLLMGSWSPMREGNERPHNAPVVQDDSSGAAA